MRKPETIMIDDTKYIKSDCVKEKAKTLDGLERCIIRSYGAGVFFGYIAEKKAQINGVNIKLRHAKRIHYWDGACSLTQLALEGSKKPNNCRITDPVPEQEIMDVIEIIPLTRQAEKNLDEVKVWKI